MLFSLSEISIGVHNWSLYSVSMQMPSEKRKEQGIFQPCSIRIVFTLPLQTGILCSMQ